MVERDRIRPVDFDIIRTPEEPPPPPVRRSLRVVWIAGVALIGAAIVATYLVLRGPGQAGPVVAARQDRPLPPQASSDLGSGPLPVTVPPLDQSDAVVRELVRQLTSHPEVAAWLATDGLIRNFTVVMANTADGATPARHLRMLRPSTPFAVTTSGNTIALDPRSYRRYDSVAAAVSSIDPAGAARLYATLKPRIAEAYKDLGHPDAPVDQAVERAIVSLLQTPTVEGPVRLHPVKGTGYAFDDPELESLTDAQKQLLRTGPDNMKVIQGSLRSIALALGIPASRLPAARTVVPTH